MSSEWPLGQAVRDRIMRSFEAWLDAVLAREEPPEGIDGEILSELAAGEDEGGGSVDPDKGSDLSSLWAATTLLAQEVKLQGRTFKQLNDTLSPLVSRQSSVDGVLEAFDRALSELARNTNARLLLEADQLIYDFDNETITAVGGVEIHYNGYIVQAARLRYYQRTGRLIASGGVRIVEPRGNVITAREVDITDDFRDGFIESLNVETAQRARFSAKRAERRDGNVTVFEQGTYTACPKCEENPDKPQIILTKMGLGYSMVKPG